MPLTVHIASRITQLYFLHNANSLCRFISLLVSQCSFLFFSPLGSTAERMSYRDFPQDSCLSSIFLNVYLIYIPLFSFVQLSSFIYANDIVLFYFNKCLDIFVDILNDALRM